MSRTARIITASGVSVMRESSSLSLADAIRQCYLHGIACRPLPYEHWLRVQTRAGEWMTCPRTLAGLLSWLGY